MGSPSRARCWGLSGNGCDLNQKFLIGAVRGYRNSTDNTENTAQHTKYCRAESLTPETQLGIDCHEVPDPYTRVYLPLLSHRVRQKHGRCETQEIRSWQVAPYSISSGGGGGGGRYQSVLRYYGSSFLLRGNAVYDVFIYCMHPYVPMYVLRSMNTRLSQHILKHVTDS